MSTDSHGSRGPLYDNPDAAKMLRELNAKALGEFPSGKLNNEDEGALTFAIGVKDGKVIINFPKPVAWMGMPPAQAVALARILLHRARQADPHMTIELPL